MRGRWLAAAILLGLALRLAFGLGYWIDKPLTLDEQEYLLLAHNVARRPRLLLRLARPDRSKAATSAARRSTRRSSPDLAMASPGSAIRATGCRSRFPPR